MRAPLTMAFVTGVLLTGCGSPAPYAREGEVRAWTGVPLAIGYWDGQVEADVYRVIFSGNKWTDPRTMYAYAIYRSAELCQEKGFRYFEVLEGAVDKSILSWIPELSDSFDSQYQRSEWQVVAGSLPHGGAPEVRDVPAYDDFADRDPSMRRVVFITVPMPSPSVPQASLVIRLRNDIVGDADRTFDSKEVISALGPHIVRPKQDAK
jgi:hypothetical protein